MLFFLGWQRTQAHTDAPTEQGYNPIPLKSPFSNTKNFTFYILHLHGYQPLDVAIAWHAYS